jgi:RNA 2',3'-cyclic 3'-phosphodiesterase
MPHEQHLRLFLAIDLPPLVRQAAGRLQSRLKPVFGAGTYPEPDNLHITLHFLGDTPVSRLPGLLGALAAVEMPALTLSLGELVFFPDARRARVAAADVTGDVDLLIDLHARLAPVLKSQGFRLDHRLFRPHVTVTRFKFPPRQGVDRAIEITRALTQIVDQFRVLQFTLYQSTLDKSGAKYAPLAHLPRLP